MFQSFFNLHNESYSECYCNLSLLCFISKKKLFIIRVQYNDFLSV
jgi:hypothetical protein